jgi:hypothetical protein
MYREARMPRPRKAPSKHATIAIFAHEELEVLVHQLNTERDFNVTAPDMLGALVLAGRSLPLDVVQALVPAYVAREREELVKVRDREAGD